MFSTMPLVFDSRLNDRVKPYISLSPHVNAASLNKSYGINE